MFAFVDVPSCGTLISALGSIAGSADSVNEGEWMVSDMSTLCQSISKVVCRLLPTRRMRAIPFWGVLYRSHLPEFALVFSCIPLAAWSSIYSSRHVTHEFFQHVDTVQLSFAEHAGTQMYTHTHTIGYLFTFHHLRDQVWVSASVNSWH